jgi:hypothetical protein
MPVKLGQAFFWATACGDSIDAATSETGAHENGMAMKMHVDAQRLGAFTGKDDEG